MGETPTGPDAGSVPEETPERRCGFYLDEESLPSDLAAVCCWRKVWKETGRCIWHADVGEKPVEELRRSRTDHPERLDGAVLRGVKAGYFHGLPECVLVRSDFTDADLDHADFTDADLRKSIFSDADLRKSDFRNANLDKSNLAGAYLRDTYFDGVILRGADLSDAILWYAALSNADLRNVDFTAADLLKADLTEATIWESDLTNAELVNANLTDASLRNADLTGANLKGAVLKSANLKDAILSNTDIRGTDFRNAGLFGTNYEDVQMDAETQFGIKNVYEANADENAETPSLFETLANSVLETNSMADLTVTGTGTYLQRKGVLPVRRFVNRAKTRAERLERAKRVYQNLQQLHRQNALPDRIPQFYVREHHTRRKLALAQGRYRDWLWLAVQRRVMLYGESPRQVAKFSGYVILVWAVLYLFTQGIAVGRPPGDVRKVTPLLEWSGPVPDPFAKIGASLYFSVVTFTTLGYGDIQPVGNVAKFLAGVEALVGAVLMALFVAVASQRVAR